MNKNIMRAVGLGEEVDAVEAGKCPFCKQKIIKKLLLFLALGLE